MAHAADIERTGLTETLKEPVEKCVGVALFVAGDVGTDVGNEGAESLVRSWFAP